MSSNKTRGLKAFALSAIAMAVLTGCTDHGPEEQTGRQPVDLSGQDEVQLDSSEHFTMTVIGEDGEKQTVAEGSETTVGDMTVKSSEMNPGALNVQIDTTNTVTLDFSRGLSASSTAPQQLLGTIQSEANNDNGVDVSGTTTGQLLFDASVFEKDNLDGQIKVTMRSGNAQNQQTSATIDVTEAMNSLVGAGDELQTVSIPLSCFTERGVDLTEIQDPFSMELYSDIDYDLDNVRLEADGLSDADHTVSCETLIAPADPVAPETPEPGEPHVPGDDEEPVTPPTIDPVAPVTPVTPEPGEPQVPGEGEEPIVEPPVDPGNVDLSDETNIALYGPDATEHYMLSITDGASGTTADVDIESETIAGFISTEPSLTIEGATTVVVDSSEAVAGDTVAPLASIQSTSTTSATINVSGTETAGALLFDLTMYEKIDKDANVSVALGSFDQAPVKVDITGMVNSFVGAMTQKVRIPLSCFTDQGLDLTQNQMPFSMELNSDLTYDLSNIRLEADVIETENPKNNVSYDFICSNDSIVLKANDPEPESNDSIVYRRVDNGSGYDEDEFTWTVANSGNNGGVVSYDGEFAKLTFSDPAHSTKAAVLRFQIPNGEANRDISHYADGNITFNLRVDSYGNMSEDDELAIRMESTDLNDIGDGLSRNILLGQPLVGETIEYSFPVIQLFTDPTLTETQGQIKYNQIQHINRALAVYVSGSNDKLGLEYSVSDVRLEMDPKPYEPPVNPDDLVDMPTVFSDNMVLQQASSVAFWGWAEPGQGISIDTSWGSTAYGTADNNGEWKLFVDTPAYDSETHTVTVSDDSERARETRFENVVFGEVWLINGQSNAGWAVGSSYGWDNEYGNGNKKAELEEAGPNEDLRIYNVSSENWYEGLKDTRDLTAGWSVADTTTVEFTPAVGYYFAERVQQELGVPVGILVTAYAGTPIEAWYPEEEQTPNPLDLWAPEWDDSPEGEAARIQSVELWQYDYDQYEQDFLNGEGYFQTGKARSVPRLAGKRCEEPQYSENECADEGLKMVKVPDEYGPEFPGNVYNGMTIPVLPYGIKGMVWYQGERNARNPYQVDYYDIQLKEMITYYRETWNEQSNGNVSAEFPAQFTQLPSWFCPQEVPVEPMSAACVFPEDEKNSYTPSTWPGSREQMLQVDKELVNTGLAVTVDTGDPRSVHPLSKAEIGLRHAYLALKNTYNLDFVDEGPKYQSHEIVDGKVIISFDELSVGSGLVAGHKLTYDLNKPINSFAITGDDGYRIDPETGEASGTVMAEDIQWQWANVEIDEEKGQIIVWSENISEPTAVRYAWAMNPATRNLLYNMEGLPASPFRTDDWDLVGADPDVMLSDETRLSNPTYDKDIHGDFVGYQVPPMTQ